MVFVIKNLIFSKTVNFYKDDVFNREDTKKETQSPQSFTQPCGLCENLCEPCG